MPTLQEMAPFLFVTALFFVVLGATIGAALGQKKGRAHVPTEKDFEENQLYTVLDLPHTSYVLVADEHNTVHAYQIKDKLPRKFMVKWHDNGEIRILSIGNEEK